MVGLSYRKSFLLVSALLGCRAGGDAPPPETATADSVAAAAVRPAPAGGAGAPVILFIGTSLTAGLGVDPDQAYPARIQARLDAAGLDYRVVNAGVSGETSAGALRRAEWLFAQAPPSVLVLETGANDGLRGQDPDTLAANIEAIFAMALALDPEPALILAGMEAPPNLGERYTTRFRGVFPRVARQTGAELIPFLLDGVGGVDTLNQADGIHPTPAGQEVIAETVWRVLEPVVRRRAQD